MRKTIYSIGFLVIESVFSVGLFTSCGDQFQEEYPWLIGKQKRGRELPILLFSRRS